LQTSKTDLALGDRQRTSVIGGKLGHEIVGLTLAHNNLPSRKITQVMDQLAACHGQFFA